MFWVCCSHSFVLFRVPSFVKLSAGLRLFEGIALHREMFLVLIARSCKHMGGNWVRVSDFRTKFQMSTSFVLSESAPTNLIPRPWLRKCRSKGAISVHLLFRTFNTASRQTRFPGSFQDVLTFSALYSASDLVAVLSHPWPSYPAYCFYSLTGPSSFPFE